MVIMAVSIWLSLDREPVEADKKICQQADVIIPIWQKLLIWRITHVWIVHDKVTVESFLRNLTKLSGLRVIVIIIFETDKIGLFIFG